MRLTLAKGIPLLEAALADGRLAAQHRKHPVVDEECKYSYKGKPGWGCAIGVMLTEKAKKTILADQQNGCVLGGVTSLQISDKQRLAFVAIQYAHDEWLKGDGSRKRFLKVLAQVKADFKLGAA